MDFNASFSEAFSGKAFSTFNDFRQVLNAFQEDTELRFIFKRTFLFPVGTPRRDTLVYKSIQYVCIESKPRTGTGCEAGFTVGSRNGFLYVSKYNMMHNHAIIPRPIEKHVPEIYVVITDYTPQFIQAFPCLVFSSLSELEDAMEEFQSRTGCMYAKRHTCPWPKHDVEHQDVVYKKFAYECFHYGHCKERGEGVQDRRSSRTGCKSVVYVTCRSNQLHISRFDMRHNHPVSGSSGNVYRRNRRLNPAQIAAVRELLKEDQHEFALKEYIQNSFQVYLTTADIRNLKRKLQPKKTSQNFIGSTLKNLGDQGLAELLTDADGNNRVITFTAPSLIHRFHLYPEVVQIQELRGAPCIAYHISVVDRDLNNESVMFAFLLDHGISDAFSLMLQSFKQLVQGKVDDIETVFIDTTNPSECHAVRKELPWARPLVYQNSVLQQVKEQLASDASVAHYHKKVLFQYFHAALKARDRDVYLKALEDIVSVSPTFWTLINDAWMPYAEQWAEHQRVSHHLTFNADTTISHEGSWGLEAYGAVLASDDNLDSCAKKLLELATHKPPPSAVVPLKREYPGQPEDIQALLSLLSEAAAARVIKHLHETSSKRLPPGSDVLTSLAERKCCCAFSTQWRLPCCHLMKAARSAYIPLPSLLKDSRWLEEWPENVPARGDQEVGEDEEVSDFMSPSAKISKIDYHLHNIQGLAASADEAKFKRRQRELKELENRWLKEDESLPGTSDEH